MSDFHQPGRRIDGEHLEVLGKHAASQWEEKRYPTLKAAVLGTLHKEAHLGAEHVRRVVEFANTAAYLAEFQKAGGAGHKVVDFGGESPVDPAEILQELNKVAGDQEFSRDLSDYHRPPARTKTAAREKDDWEKLAEAFNTETTGSLPDENPLGEAVRLWQKLGSDRDHLTSELSELEGMHGDLSDLNFRNVKQAALDGHSLAEIAGIWETLAQDPEYVKLAFAPLYERLVENQVFPTSSALVESLEKRASYRPVNPQHPLARDFVDYCTTLNKLAQVRAQRDMVNESYQELDQFLTKMSAGEGVIKKVLRAADKTVDLAGRAGHHVGEALLGAGHGDTGARVAKGAVVAGGALAGHEAYRRTLKHNPTFQKAKFHTLAAIPGTQEYNYETDRLQGGGG